MNADEEQDVWTSRQLAVADRIDILCDDFEASWVRGERPNLESYLFRCEESGRATLLAELLLVDREFRVKLGENVNRLDYQGRFPSYSDVIDGIEFATIDDRVIGTVDTIHDRALPMPGVQVGQFELLEELGSGASGSVWKARDTRLRRIVALKIPRHERLSELELERFLREGRASAQLRHPNIVTVFDVGQDAHRVFIVAQYIEGVDLRRRLRERRLSAGEAAELAAQLSEALHHAHEQGVIHRDLKPANVLIDREGRPHITDFGLAKWSAETTSMTVDGHIMGTPAYMSPEQARGDIDVVDRRTDVYGLGAMLYEMLVGRPLFEGDVAAVVHQVVHDEPIHPRKIDRSVPRDLETICLKAIEKDPRRRYLSAQEMAVDLRRYSRGEQIMVRPPNLPQRLWRMVRRRPRTLTALLALAIALVGATIIASMANERNELVKQNLRLTGHQRVSVTTNPRGAVIAIAPIDADTDGPVLDQARIIRPIGVTPLSVDLMPGEYFVEAAMVEDGVVTDFAEVRRIVPRAGDVPVALRQMYWSYEESSDSIALQPIRVPPKDVVTAEMVAIQIDDDIRNRYPGVAQVLYVDVCQTLPGTFTNAAGEMVTNISYDLATTRLERVGKRLPTAAEFDAIVEQLARWREMGNYEIRLQGLADLHPEWTASRFVDGDAPAGMLDIFNDIIVLRGFVDARQIEGYSISNDGLTLLQSRASPTLPTAYRGVRLAEPRLVTW